jgi:hypothetical protein
MQKRNLKWMVLVAGLIVIAGVVLVHPRVEPAAVAQLSTKGRPIRFQLTRLQVDLFELRCSRDQLMKLDLAELARGQAGPMKASAQEVLDRLRQLGDASLAIKYDNFVDMTAATHLTTGKSVPWIDNVSVGASGVVVPSVKYRDLGFNVTISGVWQDGTEPNLADVEFNVGRSGLPNEKIDAGYVGEQAKLTLPIYDEFQSQQHVVLRQGLPVLLACNDLSKPEGEKGLAVLVARLVATRLIE